MVDEGAQAGFALLQYTVGAIPLYRKGSQMARHIDKAQIARARRSGRAVVHSERAQYPPRARADRCRPARVQPVRHCMRPVVGPEQIVAMSSTITRLFRNMAVPQDPAAGPSGRPSISRQYC